MPHPVAYGVAWYRAESAFIREIIPRTSVAREKGGGGGDFSASPTCALRRKIEGKGEGVVPSHEREE